VLYGAVLLMAAISYFILTRVLLRHHGPQSALAQALGHDVKGTISLALYIAGMATGLYVPAVAVALYALTAAIWLAPDQRVERILEH
jgi:uncharacterized membrane protein